MIKDLRRVPTLHMERNEWLERRRNSIGGSDASSIIGLNTYSSPFSVWADKTGRLPDKPDNEAMRQGRDLEAYVASRWCEETGKKVRRENAMLYNPDYTFAHADIDRWVIGENAGLECKTTSLLNLKKFKDGEFPPVYYVQCVHYMAITGADRWYLAVLVFGQGFYHFTIDRDEDEIAALMTQEKDFWALVESDTPPDMDGREATTDALKTIYSGGGDTIELYGRDALLEEYKRLMNELQYTGDQIRKIKQTLMIDLGEAEAGVCGRFSVSWKRHKRAFISREKLRAVYPKIDLSKIMTVSNFRQFRIKEVNDAAR